MTIATGRRWAWAAGALCYLLFAAALALAAASASALRDPQLVGLLAQNLVPPMAIAVAGVLIASKIPRNPLGWILLTASLLSVASGLLLSYQIHGLVSNPGSLPGVQWATWMFSLLTAVLYPGVVLLIMLLFPDGRLPSRGWWVLVGLDVAFILLNVTVGILDPSSIQIAGLPPVTNPTGMERFRGLESGPIGFISFLGAIPLILAGVASLIVRLVRSQGVVRQQVRWVVYALVVSIVLSVGLSLSTLLIPPSPEGRLIGNLIDNAVVTLGFGVALPAAMAVAILKYRLYDIDVVINRTLVYASLAVFITAVYVGIVVGIGTLIGSGERPNVLLSIAATAVVAVAFQPVKRRVEMVANRLVFGFRATPYESLRDLSHRVAGAYADEAVLSRLAQVLVDGTGAVVASVWLSGQPKAAATWPAESQPLTSEQADRTIPVRHQGETLGQLTVKKRRGEPFTPIEGDLLADLAAQAGQVLRNARLTSDLQERVQQVSIQSAELRASRQRIVAAQDAERRRLERNIHDGAQQHLVALAVKLRLAATVARRDVEKGRRAIADLQIQTAEALATIRDLAQGIYPPALRDGGLVQSLGQHAEVSAEGVGRYDPEIEAAVYFCCLEALQNAAKYAAATRTHVELAQVDGQLRFKVLDNGVGFDPGQTPAGRGHQNMRDRIGSFGGTVVLDSAPGRGTSVAGVIPLRVRNPLGEQV